MGWRGRGGGWGRGPGWGLYGRGFGYGPGYGRGLGYGRGYGRGYGIGYGYTGDPSKCVKFPWMPRWWWANPDYAGELPTPIAATAENERQFLNTYVKGLEDELASMKKRLEELKSSEEPT